MTTFWMRSKLRHTPTHVVAEWDGHQVVTLCGWHPDPGGVLVDRDTIRELEAYACVFCARRSGRQR